MTLSEMTVRDFLNDTVPPLNPFYTVARMEFMTQWFSDFKEALNA